MPFTLRISSGVRNGSALRYSMLAVAFAGPTPGSRASSSAVAELRFARVSGVPGAALAATAPRPHPATTSPQRSPVATAFLIPSISTSLGASGAPRCPARQAPCRRLQYVESESRDRAATPRATPRRGRRAHAFLAATAVLSGLAPAQLHGV